MVGENGVPETPDWAPMPRGWDDRRCCPADCVACEPNETHLVRGEN